MVHPLLTSAEERRILAKRGVSYCTSPTGEARRSAKVGVIQLAELLEAGVKVSLSIDHTGAYGVGYFQCMRILYALHLHRIATKPRLTTKRLVQLATLDHAEVVAQAAEAAAPAPTGRRKASRKAKGGSSRKTELVGTFAFRLHESFTFAFRLQ